MDENVPLVLTGVRVINFLNITNFDLIFLHNTHILSVCLFVGLFVILFCLSCLSVCLYAFLMYSNVGMYHMCEYWSFCTSVCFSLIYCLSVCLLVCLSFFSVCPLCLSVCLNGCHMYSTVGMYCMCEYLSFCTSVCFSACTSTFAPSVCLFVCVCL